MTSDSNGDMLLDAVLVELIEAVQSSNVDLAAWVQRYPQYESEIREFLTSREGVQDIVHPDEDRELPTLPGYVLAEEIGRGGMGVVYKATCEVDGQIVAIKLLVQGSLAGAEEKQRFLLEAQIARQLQHPQIVPIYDIGEVQNQPYYVMPFYERKLLDDLPRLQQDPNQVARLLIQLADAVSYAHQQKVLHRDLKPENVVLNPDGSPCLIDFGLARLIDAQEITRTGMVLGTPKYVAPEAIEQGRKGISPATDQYGLGLILYTCLTGQPPWEVPVPVQPLDAIRLFVSICRDDPKPPSQINPQVPKDLETICLKCLEKNPKTRYLSVQDLQADLQRFVNGRRIVARRPNPLTRTVRLFRRQPYSSGVIWSGVFTILLLLAGLGYFLWQEQERQKKLEAEAILQRQENWDKEITQLQNNRTQKIPNWQQVNQQIISRLITEYPEANYQPTLRSEWMACLPPMQMRKWKEIPIPVQYLYNVVYSPDGKTLATANKLRGEEGKCCVYLCDFESGKVVRKLEFILDYKAWEKVALVPSGERSWMDGCYGMNFSPDGRWFILGTRSGQLFRWDLHQQDPKPIVWQAYTYDEKTWDFFSVFAIYFSTTEPVCITSTNREVCVWNINKNWELQKRLPEYYLPVGNQFMQDKFYVAKRDNLQKEIAEIQLYDLKTDQLSEPGVRIFRRFAVNSSLNYGIGKIPEQQGLHWFSLQKSSPLYPFPKPQGQLCSYPLPDHKLLFHTDNSFCLSTQESSPTLMVYSTLHGEMILENAIPSDSCFCDTHPTDHIIAFPELYKVTFYELAGFIEPIARLPDSNQLHSFSLDRISGRIMTIHQKFDPPKPTTNISLFTTWYAGTGQTILEQQTTDRLIFQSRSNLHWNAFLDQWIIASGGFPQPERSSQVELFDSKGFVVGTSGYRINKSAVDRLGRSWIQQDLIVRCVHLKRKDSRGVVNFLQNELPGSPASLYTTFFLEDPFLWIGRSDGTLIQMDLQTLKPTNHIKCPCNWIDAVAVSADQQTVVVGDRDGNLVFLDSTLQVRKKIEKAHSKRVWTVACGPGWVATGSEDQSIQLWNDQGEPLMTYRVNNTVRKIEISNDGKYLVAQIDNENYLRRWRIDLIQEELQKVGLAWKKAP